LQRRTSSHARLLTWSTGLAVGGLVAAGWFAMGRIEGPGSLVLFDGLMVLDPLAHFFRCLVLLAGVLVVLLTHDSLGLPTTRKSAFLAMLLFATFAMMLLASANDLLMIFLAIEFLGISSFVLVGFARQDIKSAESALKYFLVGAFSSAIMLYGMSLIYGLAGTTNMAGLQQWYSGWADTQSGPPAVFLVAVLFLLVGFGFKIAMVPFHMWVPDVYEGAPTPMTAFLAVASKAVGMAVLLRVFLGGLPALPEVTKALTWLAAITMIVGNVLALPQRNVKRLLAYSSIGHVGYILVGVVVSPQLLGVRPELSGGALVPDVALQGVLIYLLAYLFMNVGAFGVVIAVSNRTGSDDIEAYAGLSRTSPWLAGLLTLFFLSLAGIPPTAGFLAKFYIFSAAIKHQAIWLAVIGVLNSVVAVAYYFKVVYQMYFAPPGEAPVSATRAQHAPPSWGLTLALGASAVGVLGMGLFPNAVLVLLRAPLLWV